MSHEPTNGEILKVMQAGFSSVDKRFGRIENRLDTIDHRLDAVDGRLDVIDSRLGMMEGRLDQHGKLFQDMFDVLNTFATSVDKRFDDLEEKIFDTRTEMVNSIRRHERRFHAVAA